MRLIDPEAQGNNYIQVVLAQDKDNSSYMTMKLNKRKFGFQQYVQIKVASKYRIEKTDLDSEKENLSGCDDRRGIWSLQVAG